jgi:adenine deaminase
MLNPTGQPALDRRRFLFGCAAASLSGCTAATAGPRGAEHPVEFTVVIRGGRVVDPGQGVDMSMDLAIEDTRVAAIGPNLRGRIILDAAGCVVAPGFVDLHSHAQTVSAHRLQAFEGVTTTLELEA